MHLGSFCRSLKITWRSTFGWLALSLTRALSHFVCGIFYIFGALLQKQLNVHFPSKVQMVGERECHFSVSCILNDHTMRLSIWPCAAIPGKAGICSGGNQHCCFIRLIASPLISGRGLVHKALSLFSRSNSTLCNYSFIVTISNNNSSFKTEM